MKKEKKTRKNKNEKNKKQKKKNVPVYFVLFSSQLHLQLKSLSRSTVVESGFHFYVFVFPTLPVFSTVIGIIFIASFCFSHIKAKFDLKHKNIINNFPFKKIIIS